MNPQPTLFDRITTVNAHGLTLAQQFEAFHAANPHVYINLRRLALDAARRGHRMGIKALYEVLRWQYTMNTNTNTDGEFKLNNNYTSFYARLLMQQEPELNGYFETRTQTWRTVKQ